MSPGEDKRGGGGNTAAAGIDPDRRSQVSFLLIAINGSWAQDRGVSRTLGSRIFGSLLRPVDPGFPVMAAMVLFLPFSGTLPAEEPVHPPCYPKIPVSLKSKLLRLVLKPVSPLSNLAFHGRYSGPGNEGGRPLNPMDELFRRHGIVYVRATSLETLLEADRMLAIQLQKLKGASFLSPDCEAYRQRAIRFLLSPKNRKKGKPFRCLRETEEQCPHFAGPDALARFFHLSHPALPELAPHQLKVTGSSPPRVKLKDFLSAWPE